MFPDAALTRDVWQLNATEFPTDGSLESQARFILKYAILAPSSHNSQPWEFDIGDDKIVVRADETRWLREADPDKRELYLSLGCALENIVIAAQHFDLPARVVCLPFENGVIADVTLTDDTSVERPRAPELFDAMTSRRTSHAAFASREMSATFRKQLESRVLDDGTALDVVQDADTKARCATMQREADEKQMEDAAYRQELSEWLGEGALGDSWPKARISQFVVNHFDLGKSEGANNAEHIRRAPAIALISSVDDSAEARMRAGQLYQRLSLTAESQGVSVHPLSQMLELPEYRPKLGTLFGLDTRFTQHFFRMGYAEETGEHTPRWPLETFLVE